MNEEICKKCRHCLSCMCGDEFEDCGLKDPKFKKQWKENNYDKRRI